MFALHEPARSVVRLGLCWMSGSALLEAAGALGVHQLSRSRIIVVSEILSVVVVAAWFVVERWLQQRTERP